MSLQDLGNLGAFIGAVAVVASLIYLAVQVRQNTRAVLSSTQQGLFSTFSELSSLVIQNPDVARLLGKIESDPESLSAEDRTRFEWLATRVFGQFENAFAQHHDGLLEPKHWDAYAVFYRDAVSSPAFRRFWEGHKPWYFQDFVAYVDSEVFDNAPAA